MVEFVVCDDDSKTIDNIKKIIKEIMIDKKLESNIISFNDYDYNFKKFVSSNKKQLIYILDVEMPSDSGKTMARYIRNLDKKSVIIILTSHHESADEIYKGRLNILTFVSKRDRCDLNMRLAIEDSLSYVIDEDIVEFSEQGSTYSFKANDILYIVKDFRKTVIKTTFDRYELYISLDKIKGYLPQYFKQSHRACIINLRRVNKINSTKKEIYFDNGEMIDFLGDKYKKELVG